MGRWRLVLAGAAVTAALPATAGVANAPTGDFATGGGQLTFDLGADRPIGEDAGSTIAFNARQIAPDGTAQGEIQRVDQSSAPRGAVPLTVHASVVCMHAEESTAVILYETRRGNDRAGLGQLYVVDNGEGPTDDLLIQSDSAVEADCQSPPAPPTNRNSLLLGRGNVQVHDAD